MSSPDDGNDLVMVVSHQGRGVFDMHTGTRIARDPDPDYAGHSGPDLSCLGIGPLAGMRVRIAGLFGGGLHAFTEDGWAANVVRPDWPNERVMLSRGDIYRGQLGQDWWHIHHETASELRAVGFSPSGRTIIIASSGGLNLFTRADPQV